MREQFKFKNCKICGKEIFTNGDDDCGYHNRNKKNKYSNFSYNELLKTEEWKIKRNEILFRDGCCTKCKSIDKLQVHHTYYFNQNMYYPWNYPNDSLVTLCEKCHKEHHINEENSYKKFEYNSIERQFKNIYGELEEYFDIEDLVSNKKSKNYFEDYLNMESVYLIENIYIGKTKNLYTRLYGIISECTDLTSISKIKKNSYIKNILMSNEKIKIKILSYSKEETKKLIKEYYISGYPLVNKYLYLDFNSEKKIMKENKVIKKCKTIKVDKEIQKKINIEFRDK